MKKEKFKRILVTSALPYANGPIHLGHLAGAYLPPDIYVRYQRLKGRDVLFICGSDEHGVPITLTADKEKTTPQAIVNRYHAMNKEAFEKFGMSFDNYSRTSLPLHHQTAQEFFLEFYRRGILKEKAEKQLYCEHDKMFLADRYVEGKCPNCGFEQARGDQCEQCGTWINQIELIDPKCTICGNTPVVRDTKHFYFSLGEFQKRLEEYVHSKKDWKENVLKYCESWFKKGLADRAVTRDLRWGIPLPKEVQGGEGKVIYVWFEALLGYISSTKEWVQKIGKPEKWREYWQRQDTKYVAFIGKDNVVFHCIVFPAMFMAWNDGEKEKYVLPDNVPANEFLNFEGQKFSKSRGWGIDLKDFIAVFPVDPLRYALAVNLPEQHDADFYLKDFQAKNNNELADILGNFVNRTLAFVQKNFSNKVPKCGTLNKLDRELVERLKETPEKAGYAYERYRFRDGVLEVMNLARAANKYFNDSEPWKTIKENPDQCATTLNLCLQTVRSLSILIEPVLPFSSKKLWKMLNLKDSVGDEGWESAGELKLPEGHLLGKSEILFTKIEDTTIEKLLKDLESTPAASVSTNHLEHKPFITIDEFKKVDLRVAKVLECERVPRSDKLLKLQVEIGAERHQIVAGIAQYYKPEDLIGQSIVVVANLQPAKLMGNESQGMLLAAESDSGKLCIVTVDGDAPSGSVVK